MGSVAILHHPVLALLFSETYSDSRGRFSGLTNARSGGQDENPLCTTRPAIAGHRSRCAAFTRGVSRETKAAGIRPTRPPSRRSSR